MGEGILGHGAGVVSVMDESRGDVGSMRSNHVAMVGVVGVNVE